MSQNMNLSMTPYTQAGAFVCSQYDVGRECQITLQDENGSYTIPTGATVTIQATKPSGFGFSVECTWSGSTVTFATTETMTSEFGRFPAELRITSGNTVLGTTNFYFKVERSPHPEGTVDGDAETAQALTLRVDALEGQMATVQSDITDVKADIGDLSELETEDKTSLVNAINEATQGANAEAVNALIEAYITEHHIEGVTDEEIQEMVDTYLEGGSVEDAVNAWLVAHPEATTTVQDGSITMAKLATEVKEKMSETDLTYKWNAVGYMRTHVRDFQGWAQNVVYDPDLGCAVGIINSGNGSHTNAQPWYRVTIDNSGYMSPYQAIKVYDTDGTTEITPTVGYMGTTCRLSNGTYMCISAAQTIYTSTDKLVTLKKERTYNFTTNSDSSMFSLTELSNGRLICGHGGNVNGFWYSDDDGVTWTNVKPVVNSANIGQQLYPEGDFKPFEPCFIECGNGKIIAYARKSNGAYTTNLTPYTQQEPAVYSVSTDYGTTWTAWQNSTSITDMTSNNGKCVVIDGVVHFVYGSRYDAVDADFKLFYTYAKLEDVYSDNWAEPVLLDVGHWTSNATAIHDCGYPSLWKDENNNLYAVYYDSDGTGTAFGANWRLCTGAPVEKSQAVYNGGSGSYNVAYSQKAVDDKFANIQTKINEILLLLDQIPEDTGEYDGTAPIYSGLATWFDVTNESKWESGVSTSMIGNEITAYATNAAFGGSYIKPVNTNPAVYNNGFANNVRGVFVRNPIESLVGSVESFTIEGIYYLPAANNFFILKENNKTNSSNTANPNVFVRLNNFGGYKQGVRHFTAVFTSGSIDWYVDGIKIITESTSVEFSNILASYPLLVATNDSGNVGDVRIYNRALTADEIRNNYLYTQHETDYTTAPVFTTE